MNSRERLRQTPEKYRVPNLFIIGAPKCGTTAMSYYLAGHPNIYMSEEGGIKEPKFFCSDRWYEHQTHPTTWDEYLAIFKSAPASARYIGEATPRYLQSENAIPGILNASHDPRFVVMLRNPVDIVASQHNQRVKTGQEDKTIEKAWNSQNERINGKSLPPGISDGRFVYYADHAKLGQQMQKLLRQVDREKVHWIFFEDFKRGSGQCYRDLVNWLGLPDDGRTDFTTRNTSVTFRLKRLENVLRKAGRIRQRLGIGGLGLHKKFNRLNTKPGREPLNPEFRRELQDYFRQDIKLLSRLVGRDLSHWYAQ